MGSLCFIFPRNFTNFRKWSHSYANHAARKEKSKPERPAFGKTRFCNGFILKQIAKVVETLALDGTHSFFLFPCKQAARSALDYGCKAKHHTDFQNKISSWAILRMHYAFVDSGLATKTCFQKVACAEQTGKHAAGPNSSPQTRKQNLEGRVASYKLIKVTVLLPSRSQYQLSPVETATITRFFLPKKRVKKTTFSTRKPVTIAKVKEKMQVDAEDARRSLIHRKRTNLYV